VDHFKEIYAHKAAQYHRMISSEDVEGNLLQAIGNIIHTKGNTILDLGSGTGRIPLLLRNAGAKIISLDLNFPMLQEQKQYRHNEETNWNILQADMRFLPFRSEMMNGIIAGWAIGHFCAWYESDWQIQIKRVLTEMHRMAAPQAVVMILETMTTGSLTPAPPTPGLAQYYAWLETEWGFSRAVVQTDYQFETVDQAIEFTEFFFGPELSDTIRKNAWARLPEWTGIWYKQLP
jgi:ubiquinone/menaquinone biosynthesis C-methylase UbiE